MTARIGSSTPAIGLGKWMDGWSVAGHFSNINSVVEVTETTSLPSVMEENIDVVLL